MEFEHLANALCLELANSVPDRRDGGVRDWLRQPEMAKLWIESLDRTPAGQPTSSELDELISLREATFSVFAAIANDQLVPADELATITEAHATGLAEYGFVPSGQGVERGWPRVWDVRSLTAVFADSAVKELTGDRLDRVKVCPSCQWLFIDTSRNRSRRWCSMQTCGGRDKALRHYHKARHEED